MSELRDVLKAIKSDIVLGPWTDEKLKNRDFPLRRSSYPLTRRWRWQVISFRADGRRFRILAAYHTLVPEYFAILAEDVGNDSRIVARWEFHQSHAGWHIHSCCSKLDDITVGVVHPLGVKRIPAAKNSHRRGLFVKAGFVIDDTMATAIACHRYKVPHTLDLLSNVGLP
ncbi:hypothetical protein EVB88_062 [Rhizobium phage RHph_N28_2]|nr:hypothetical protein EVB88_062 [Rhizobium phage RHph_N28_2]